MIGEGVYLRTYLTPFSEWLDRADVTDILVNRPGEVWIDGVRGFEHHAAPDVTSVKMSALESVHLLCDSVRLAIGYF